MIISTKNKISEKTEYCYVINFANGLITDIMLSLLFKKGTAFIFQNKVICFCQDRKYE